MGVCTLPAILLGSIFHYYIRLYQLNYLLVLFITIVAIALTNLLTFFLVLYSRSGFEIYWFYLGMIVTGIYWNMWFCCFFNKSYVARY